MSLIVSLDYILKLGSKMKNKKEGFCCVRLQSLDSLDPGYIIKINPLENTIASDYEGLFEFELKKGEVENQFHVFVSKKKKRWVRLEPNDIDGKNTDDQRERFSLIELNKLIGIRNDG